MKCIVAASINGVIGRGNGIPWKLPVDMKRFKELTLGQRVVMGSNTFRSLPNQELPERHHLVLTHNPDQHESYLSETKYWIEFVNKQQADELDLSDAWLIGGQQIYALFADKVTELHLTLIHNPVHGDVWFPWGCYTDFELVNRTPVRVAKNGIPYSFLQFNRKEKK
jgi:dihydrofolate reductase